MKKNTNIVIIDDDKFSRTVLEKTLASIDNFHICATFDNAEECLLYLTNNNDIDLVITEMRLPKMSGVEASKVLKEINPNLKIILLIANHPDCDILSVLYANVDAYVLKELTLRKLYKIIDIVLHDEVWIDMRLQHLIFDVIKSFSDKEYLYFKSMLTTKETNLINMVLKGFKKKEVAIQLKVSISELSEYVYSIFEKLSKIKDEELIVRKLRYDFY